MKKEMRKLRRKAEAQGWRVEDRGSGHVAWLPPHGCMVLTSKTPSDHRAFKNMKADLRRAGLDA